MGDIVFGETNFVSIKHTLIIPKCKSAENRLDILSAQLDIMSCELDISSCKLNVSNYDNLIELTTRYYELSTQYTVSPRITVHALIFEDALSFRKQVHSLI